MGENYEFQPEASDPSGQALSFSIDNLPSWAQFDTATGMLQGTPTQADIGTYQNIVIHVSNGTETASLDPFLISVEQMGSGSATVSWVPPLKNTDGSVLKDLKGFHIHYGRSSGKLDRAIKIKNASISRYVIDNLTSGTWYFAVAAYNSKDVGGSLSGVRSKVIP